MSLRGTFQALARVHFPELFWQLKLLVAARELTSCASAWSLNCLEDAALRSIIRTSLKHGGCGVDIGASIGDFTSVMASASKAATHHAFEANPAVAGVLARRFRHKNVVVHCEALSADSGTANLYVPLTNTGVGGLRITSAAEKEGQVREVRIPVRRLDDYLDQIDRCCIIKLDIEGAELLALRGARSLILRDKPLVYFECTNHAGVYGYGAEDISDFFSSLEYEIRDPFSYLAALAPLGKECFADRVANRRNYNFVAVDSKIGLIV